MESKTPSVISCRIRRKRLAPTARRIANSLRRAAPRASSMFARFMHAMVMIRPSSVANESHDHRLHRARNRRGFSAFQQSHASGFVGESWIRRILLVQAPRDGIETGFRGFHRDAGRQTQHRQKLLGIVFVQNIVPEFRRKRGWNGDGDKQLGRDEGQRAIEILRRDSHDGGGLPVQVQHLPQRIGRRVHPIAPETIADHHHRRVARFIERIAEHASTLRPDAEHRKIVGRYKLPEHALRLRVAVPLECDVERDALLERRDASEQGSSDRETARYRGTTPGFAASRVLWRSLPQAGREKSAPTPCQKLKW